VIADIHGNWMALEAVLGELERLGVDRLVCLGDVAALGPRPREVVRRLRELDVPCVLGNTDAWNIDLALLERESDTAVVQDMVRWSTAQLAADDLDWLRSFPLTRQIALGGESLVMFHGSPHSNNAVLAATTPGEELDELFAGYDATLFAGGHTHIQLLRRHGDLRLLNPGSVGLPGTGPGTPGLPVNERSCWAEFAIVDTSRGVSVDLRRLPLDADALRASVLGSELPHPEWWIERWALHGSQRVGQLDV
jgi:putative phosphoesterase